MCKLYCLNSGIEWRNQMWSIESNEWTNLAVFQDGKLIFLFLNGRQQKQASMKCSAVIKNYRHSENIKYLKHWRMRFFFKKTIGLYALFGWFKHLRQWSSMILIINQQRNVKSCFFKKKLNYISKTSLNAFHTHISHRIWSKPTVDVFEVIIAQSYIFSEYFVSQISSTSAHYIRQSTLMIDD